MVCGRLPFGDDNQVAKNLRRPLEFTEALTEGNMHKCVDSYMTVYLSSML